MLLWENSNQCFFFNNNSSSSVNASTPLSSLCACWHCYIEKNKKKSLKWFPSVQVNTRKAECKASRRDWERTEHIRRRIPPERNKQNEKRRGQGEAAAQPIASQPSVKFVLLWRRLCPTSASTVSLKNCSVFVSHTKLHTHAPFVLTVSSGPQRYQLVLCKECRHLLPCGRCFSIFFFSFPRFLFFSAWRESRLFSIIVRCLIHQWLLYIFY